jgi:hypothetical protein
MLMVIRLKRKIDNAIKEGAAVLPAYTGNTTTSLLGYCHDVLSGGGRSRFRFACDSLTEK